MARDNIRNFCIIAHIDHGKSTLSDRILELTKSVDERTMEDQILDSSSSLVIQSWEMDILISSLYVDV